jgi:hypothetical protein
MDLICVIGPVPGRVIATISHEGGIRQLPMDVARHPAGGWQARSPGGRFGLRCHTVSTAVLLEASESYTEPAMATAAA